MGELDRLQEELITRLKKVRGIQDERVLEAIRNVPREEFVPDDLVEYAYEDTALPIGEGQVITQPYLVALMTAVLQLSESDRVLEIGTGSGYAAAILSRIAAEVYTIERISSLARTAGERFERLGYQNIHLRIANGTLGWKEHAPFDGIMVSAGGPEIPEPLLDQLTVGGRLVIPVGASPESQKLIRAHRLGEDDYRYDELDPVRFVPLVGERGWSEDLADHNHDHSATEDQDAAIQIIQRHAEPIASVDQADLRNLLSRIGAAKVVLVYPFSHLDVGK